MAMYRTRSLVLLALFAVGASGCTTDFDCSLAGQCVNGECKCESWTTGSDCAALNTFPVKQVAPLVEENHYATRWGGSVVKGTDGQYHLFSAEMANNASLGVWGYNSTVIHSVSSNPVGPYKRREVAIPAEAHNPVLSQATDGTWLIWTCGCPSPAGHSGLKCPGGLAASWTTTVYSSSSLNGPWKPHVNVLGDIKGDVGTQNVSPIHKSDGSVMLMFKGPDNNTEASIAVASSWKGPYTLVAKNVFSKYFNENITNEDCYWWQSPNGNYHMLSHRMTPADRGSSFSGGHGFAKNITDWRYAATPAYSTAVNTDSGVYQLQRRERPQILFDDVAKTTPLMLINGVVHVSSDHINPHTFAQCLGNGCP